MGDAGSGDHPETAADLVALPPELAGQSMSQVVIILPFDAALQAIAHRTQNGRLLESWEGWVKMRDGSRARSLSQSGSFALSRDPARAAEAAIAAIKRAEASWKRNPEYPGAQLCFGLTFGAADRAAGST